MGLSVVGAHVAPGIRVILQDSRLVYVLGWLRRRRIRARGVTRPVRSEAVEATRVELAELAPDAQAYLGQLAYLTLVLFENLGRGAAVAPTVSGKSRLGRVAAEVLEIHEAVLGELEARHIDPSAAMEPYRPMLDDFQRRTQGDDWHEILITCYLTSGFLLDFFAGLSAGLPGGLADRISALLADETATRCSSPARRCTSRNAPTVRSGSSRSSPN